MTLFTLVCAGKRASPELDIESLEEGPEECPQDPAWGQTHPQTPTLEVVG